MQTVERNFRKRLASRLKRSSYTTCSDWTVMCRVMGQPYPGPWSFKHHPWLKGMQDCADPEVVGQKAAQMGFTECLLNKTFFEIDINQQSVLYLLPAQNPYVTDFTNGRFNPALEASPYLARLFSDVKNVGHKRAGNVSLYIRGAKSRAGLKSIPVAVIFFDELEEMAPEMIRLAEERSSGQVEKQSWKISTPSVFDAGINQVFNQSTQDHWFFRCPACSRFIELKFPESLSGDAVICYECKAPLPHESKPDWLKGEWVSSYSNRDIRGFYINQMYSCAITPQEYAQSYRKSLLNPFEATEFQNSKNGLPYEAEGARVTQGDIQACVGNRKMGAAPFNDCFITMGVDIGVNLHYVIVAYRYDQNLGDINSNYRAYVLEVGEVQHFEQIHQIIDRTHLHAVVIDAQPERRKALETANRYPNGLVSLCFYSNQNQGKVISRNKDESTISVDRTSWLDTSLGRFKAKRIDLPFDRPHRFDDHIRAPVRIYKKDALGNPSAAYSEGNAADHWAHAHNYAEIALALCGDISQARDILTPI